MLLFFIACVGASSAVRKKCCDCVVMCRILLSELLLLVNRDQHVERLVRLLLRSVDVEVAVNVGAIVRIVHFLVDDSVKPHSGERLLDQSQVRKPWN